MAVRLASDPVGDVAKQYGVYKEEENVSFRSLFVLDCEGRIVSVEKCDFPVGCSMEDQLRQAGAAQSPTTSLSAFSWGAEEGATDRTPAPGSQDSPSRASKKPSHKAPKDTAHRAPKDRAHSAPKDKALPASKDQAPRAPKDSQGKEVVADADYADYMADNMDGGDM